MQFDSFKNQLLPYLYLMFNENVSDYLLNASNWQEEMQLLRDILIDCNLREEWKWKQPCYTFDGNSVVIIGAFKHNVRLGFFKGALLADTENILSKPGENSHHTRQLVFTSIDEIQKLKNSIRQYVFEAVEIEKAGLQIPSVHPAKQNYPEELNSIFLEDKNFEQAFNALTPGRQRAYLLFFNAAKQSATKTNRIKKYHQRILMGKGINDCVCGLSKRKPNCDGSHKQLKKPLPF